tara:strand:- start:322 stop:522 length:201 start_codon:yes stop_codon:yes gene_type:complete
MRVKYIMANPAKFGDVRVQLNDVLDLPEKQAEEALTSGFFVPADREQAPKTSKSKKKSTQKTEEES